MPSRKRIRLQFFGRCLLGLAGVAGAAAIPARAAALSPAATLVGCSATGATPSFIQDSMFCSLGGVTNATASATLPFASVTATASAVAGGHTAQANAGATYYFQVIGGSAGDLVSVGISATATVSSTEAQSPKGYASAGFVTFTTFEQHSVGGNVACTYQTACQTLNTSFSGTRTVLARSGDTGNFVNITAFAFAQTGISGLTGEFATAFADPYIFIDPSFPNADLYSIVVSPGVANQAAAAPEPAMLYLAGTALGALALRWRRRFPYPQRQIH